MHISFMMQGCDHEFCTQCALYLCSTNPTSTSTHGPPGSIACPLCRHGIVSFVKLPGARPLLKQMQRSTTTNLSLTFCTCASEVLEDTADMTTPFCKPATTSSRGSKTSSSPSRSFRSLSCQRFSSFRMNTSLCLGSDVSPSLVPCSRNPRNHLARCSGSGFRRSSSQPERRKSWFCSLNQSVATGSGCWFLFFYFWLSLYICFSFITPIYKQYPTWYSWFQISSTVDTHKLVNTTPIVQLGQAFILFWQQISRYKFKAADFFHNNQYFSRLVQG